MSHVSPQTHREVDEVVSEIIRDCYQQAEDLLRGYMPQLHLMKDALMEYETIGEVQIDEIMAGQSASPPKDWEEEKARREQDMRVAADRQKVEDDQMNEAAKHLAESQPQQNELPAVVAADDNDQSNQDDQQEPDGRH